MGGVLAVLFVVMFLFLRFTYIFPGGLRQNI